MAVPYRLHLIAEMGATSQFHAREDLVATARGGGGIATLMGGRRPGAGKDLRRLLQRVQCEAR